MSLLPAFVAFPPAKLKKQIDPSEWNALLLAWNALARAYVGLSEDDFVKQALRPEAGLELFLESFVSHWVVPEGSTEETDLERSLKQSCFTLISRFSKLKSQKLLRLHSISFIQELCSVYLQWPQLAEVVQRLWLATRRDHVTKLVEWKSMWTKNLTMVSRGPSSPVTQQLTRLVACVKSGSSCGSFLMEGSDFLDSLVSAWEQSDPETSRRMAIITFYCLISLIKGEPKNTSLLLDHLYSLKTNYEEKHWNSNLPSLLEELLGTTPMMPKLTQEFTTKQGRGHTLLQDLQTIVKQSTLPQPRVKHRRLDKGKAKATDHSDGDMHIHKLSLITQVQDLFPDLGVPRILQLLDAYDDNPERVIGFLLDNPPSPPTNPVISASVIQPLPTVSEAMSKLPTHTPYISQLPMRRNIYDHEDLAELALDPSRLFTGHKPETTVLQTPSTSTKAAILSALAAFDSDSDERDDTYDVDDVGGTVDTTVSGTGDDDTNVNEETLYLAWKSTPTLFTRDAAARRSKARAELREKTNLTDESIEGWGIMLSRDPRRQARLANRYSTFAGQQTKLQSSSWQAGTEPLDSEGEVQQHHTDRGRGGRYRGRGAGRGRGRTPDGGPGNTSASGGQQNTANNRRKKDANKGSRANHNRRDQRAKKISRAGFPV